MTTLADPLAKPVWPVIDASLEEPVVNLLATAIAPLKTITDPKELPDLFENVTLGFNSTMAAIEAHMNKTKRLEAIFVCRSDIPAPVSQPFALASSAGQIRLIALPKGARARLSEACGRDVGIIGVRENLDQVLKLVADVGPAETSWAYVSSEIVPRKKAAKKS